MEQKKWTQQQMEEQYNHTSSKVAKLLMIVLIFLFSIPISLIFFRKGYFYTDHLAYATEFMNFIIYVVLFILPYLILLGFALAAAVFDISPNVNFSSVYGLLLLFLTLWSYLYISAKRVYGTKWVVPRTILLTLSTGLVVILYRYILFQITILIL